MPDEARAQTRSSSQGASRSSIERSKNIVICCDGTGNEFGDANSNVVKLYTALAHR
jgi:uncharacterized protein (DUF2235 family)